MNVEEVWDSLPLTRQNRVISSDHNIGSIRAKANDVGEGDLILVKKNTDGFKDGLCISLHQVHNSI